MKFFTYIFVIFLYQLNLNSKDIQSHSWGNSKINKINNSVFEVELNLLNNLENKISVVPSLDFLYSIKPSEEILVEIKDYKSTTIDLSNLKYVNQFYSESDSSMIYESYSTGIDDFAKLIPKHLNSKIDYSFFRNIYIAHISLPKIFYSSNQLNIVNSVTLKITHLQSNRSNSKLQISNSSAKDFHNKDFLKELILNYSDDIPLYQVSENDSTGNWFNTTSTYLKFSIGKDGIYKITNSDLQTVAPFLQNTNPKFWQLFNKGKEIPINIFGQSDNSFDHQDFLEFPAELNYTKTHHQSTSGKVEYQEYLNRYSDSSIYFLTIGNSFGKRVSLNNFSSQPIETLRTYTETFHQEKNYVLQFAGEQITQSNYRWTSGDLFLWSWLNANGQANSDDFNLSDFATSGDSAIISAKFSSWGASSDILPAHNIGIKFNNAPVLDSALLERFQHKTLSTKIPTSQILSVNNKISIVSRPTASTFMNAVMVDWFEISFQRKIKAVNDSLIIRFPNLKNSAIRAIEISGLSTNEINIHKLETEKKEISNISFSGSSPNITATFIDSISPNDIYFVQKKNKYLTPSFHGTKLFINLRANSLQTDYLLITNPIFKDEAIPYANEITSSLKLKTKLILVDDIYDEYNFGYFDPEAIRSFLKSTKSWSAPMPSYLFLVGDASYDYKFHFNKPNAKNFVPSLGVPVSDPAFTIFSDSLPIPQMFIGRLPINYIGELTQYLSKVKQYLQSPNDDWNKKYLFFSGGKSEYPSELLQYREYNNNVINNHITPIPIAGYSTHLYKTINPQSDFGPYSTSYIKDAISNGGLFISYIGHSGTQTWDNGIVSPVQLKNNRNRYPLIIDFGCSTGRWAEPDIKSFSESFVVGNEANSLWYIGNSFLGFKDNLEPLVKSFFKSLIGDSIYTVGKAHAIAKYNLLIGAGLMEPYALAAMYTNTLIGDPSIEIAIPKKVNLSIEPKYILSASEFPSEENDSTKLKLIISNFGLVKIDSFEISIKHTYNNITQIEKLIKTRIPYFQDTLNFYIQTKNKPGIHNVAIGLDVKNNISELREDDNSATQSININSVKFVPISPFIMQNSKGDELVFLRPNILNQIPTEIFIDTLKSFSTAIIVPLINEETVFRAKIIPSLAFGKRYFWKIPLGSDSTKFSYGNFKTENNPNINYSSSDSLDFSSHKTQGVNFNNGMLLSKTPLHFRLITSGKIDGNFGVLEINGKNVLPNSFTIGHTITVFDTINYAIVKQNTFNIYHENPNWQKERDSLISFLNTVPQAMIVCAQIIDEGTINLSSQVRNAYKTIGSAQIDKVVNVNDSWGIIGRKGAVIGSVPEMYKQVGIGKVLIETTFVKNETIGIIETPVIGPATSWSKINIENVLPFDTKIITQTIGISTLGAIDTLSTDSTSILNFLNNYPYRKFIFTLKANSNSDSPILNKWLVESTGSPELAILPNSISLSKNILSEGEHTTLSAKFWNVGFAKAESVKVNISINDSLSSRILLSKTILNLNQNDSSLISLDYDSRNHRGNFKFIFEIDPQNTIAELVETNNRVEIPISIIGDTIKPKFNFYADGEPILNGDFVRQNPEILIQFSDNNLAKLSLNDSSLFSIFLNFSKVNFSDIIFIPSSQNFGGEIKWNPVLELGENIIQFYMQDAAGNISDTLQINLIVSNNNSIQDLFPIPNPFSNSTYISFKLLGSNNPDEVAIKIYTVAGRLIKTLKIENPKIGFQKIFWDGKDSDGDEIGNGVYLFSVICKTDNDDSVAFGKLVKLN